MTLPTSGTLTLGMIQTEFSAPGGTGLTDFYRGGTYVPNSSANANVPTSGTISILDFYGASEASPSLTVTASPTRRRRRFCSLFWLTERVLGMARENLGECEKARILRIKRDAPQPFPLGCAHVY